MEISIPCETYVRLAAISNYVMDGEKRDYLRCVRVEISNKNIILVATNVKCAAIEFIGTFDVPDYVFHVTVDEKLVNQAKSEMSFNSNITFIADNILQYVSAKTTFGYEFAGNAGIFTNKENELNLWRDWFPQELPTKTNGGIFAELQLLKLLSESSPSGTVIFPEFIDNKMPVMLQDSIDPNWLGLFMPNGEVNSRSPEPFAIPSWVKK